MKSIRRIVYAWGIIIGVMWVKHPLQGSLWAETVTVVVASLFITWGADGWRDE